MSNACSLSRRWRRFAAAVASACVLGLHLTRASASPRSELVQGSASPGPPVSAGAAAASPGPAASGAPDAKAFDLLRQGKAAEAAPLFAMALAKDPANDANIEGRVRSLILNGRSREALDEARRYAAARPSSPLVQTALGEALYRAGRFDEAAAAVAPLAAAEAPPPFAVLVQALVLAARGKDDEAAAAFDHALALAPNERDVLFWSAGAAATRAEAVARLERYLAVSVGDDPDRIDGAKGTIRLYKALGEKPVWVPAARPATAEIPLQPILDRNARVTGYLVEVVLEGAPSQDGKPSGSAKPIRLLLDTGSTGLFMVDRIAVKAGFSPVSEETTFAGGGTGRLDSRRGLFAKFTLGELRFTDALASTTTDEIDPTGRYAGVLGLSVFHGYEVTLDLSRGKLRLGPPPAQDFTMTVGSRPSPYWTVESQMLVEAGTSSGASGLFLFDTGATSSLISQTLAGGRLGDRASVHGYGGSLEGARVVQGARLRFQDLETLDPRLTAVDLSQRSRLGGVEVSGYVGLDLLARNVIKVDTVNQRIQVVKPAKK